MLISTVQDEKQLNGAHMIETIWKKFFSVIDKEFKNVESYIEK